MTVTLETWSNNASVTVVLDFLTVLLEYFDLLHGIAQSAYFLAVFKTSLSP